MGLCGYRLNIPRGTKLIEENAVIKTEKGENICYTTSENAKRYFSRNEDGCGLERGEITYKIAFSQKRKEYRFSEKEIKLLIDKWKKFIKSDCDYILFNDDFFNANILELRQMESELREWE